MWCCQGQRQAACWAEQTTARRPDLPMYMSVCSHPGPPMPDRGLSWTSPRSARDGALDSGVQRADIATTLAVNKRRARPCPGTLRNAAKAAPPLVVDQGCRVRCRTNCDARWKMFRGRCELDTNVVVSMGLAGEVCTRVVSVRLSTIHRQRSVAASAIGPAIFSYTGPTQLKGRRAVCRPIVWRRDPARSVYKSERAPPACQQHWQLAHAPLLFFQERV